MVRNRELLKDNNSADDADLRYLLTTQAIALNALHRLKLGKTGRNVPHQIVVVGPTQVGKSTLTNILLQQPLAESSAEAGFTVHCQGFHVVQSLKDRYTTGETWATAYFGELQQSPQRNLDRQVLGEYSLQETQSADSPFSDSVIWDTPDFDSIRSFDYRAPLIKAVALADVVVFVVSKEKYADKTVWVMLELLAALNVPVVIVMNKTPVDVRAELKASVENKYRNAITGNGLPPICFIDEYPRTPLEEIVPLIELDEIVELQRHVKSQLKRAEPDQLRTNAVGFIRQHWKSWTASVSAEHRLQKEYLALVNTVTAETVRRYRTEYIDSDRHREVIQLALSELLVLLEVPGMAKPLSKIRSVVTWPVRTLIKTAKEPSPIAKDDRNEERRLLDELGKHSSASLIASIARKESGSDAEWWRQLREQVVEAEPEIQNKYDQSLDNYHTRSTRICKISQRLSTACVQPG